MKIREKIQGVFGVSLIFLAIIVLVYTAYIMISRIAYYDINGLIISSIIFVTPLLIGSLCLINIESMYNYRPKVGKYMTILMALFYLLILTNILYNNGYRQMDIASVTTVFSRLQNDANFIPFKTIIFYIRSLIDGSINTSTSVLNLMANILLFLPAGIFLPSIFIAARKRRNTFIILLVGIIIMESFQFALGYGSFDIDDIILNFLGGVIGWYIWNVKYVQFILKKMYIVIE